MASLASIRRTLPRYASSLVGRDRDIDHIADMALDPGIRLITLCGPAGIGKTRLAVYVAGEIEPKTADGAVYIPLSTIQDPELVLPEIGKAFGLQGDDLEALIGDAWASFDGVVVLDNLEQVIDCASDLARCLSRARRMTVIATSQSPLQIDGERVVRLDPLDVPPEQGGDTGDPGEYTSVRLFIDRAREHDASFQLHDDPDMLRAVAEVCRRLDGMPLAIELAAARTVVLTPSELLSHLDRGLAVLASSRRDAPERLRTMHAAIAWTYDLLADVEQRVFRWLSVFPAGFDLELVERLVDVLKVDDPAIDIVGSLMDRSLIRRSGELAISRFYMLSTLREFGHAALAERGELDAAESFLADWVVELAQEADAMMTGPGQAEWIRRLDREFPNVRIAVDWALEHHDPHVPMLVVAGMWRYIEQIGRWREAVEWVNEAWPRADVLPTEQRIAGLIGKVYLLEGNRQMDRALEDTQLVAELLDGVDAPELHARYLNVAGIVAHDQTRMDDAFDFHQQAAEVASAHGLDRQGIVAMSNLATISYYRGDLAAADHYWNIVAERMEAFGDFVGLANVLSNLGSAAMDAGHYDQSLNYLSRALDIDRQIGLGVERLYPLLNLGDVHARTGDLEAALDALQDAADLAHRHGYAFLEATAFINLADVYDQQEDVVTAASMVQRALALISPEDNSRQLAEVGTTLASIAFHSGRHADGVALATRSFRLREEISYVLPETKRTALEGLLAASRSVLGGTGYAHQVDMAEGWSVETYQRMLGLVSRKIIGRRHAMVVTIEPAQTLPGLTPREQEVLQLLVDGHSTRSMASTLSVSPRTVTTHLANIMAKLDASSRAEVVAIALKQQLVPSGTD